MVSENTFTIDEVANILGVSSRTVYQYIYDGKLRAGKIRGRWTIHQKDLDEYQKSAIQYNIEEQGRK